MSQQQQLHVNTITIKPFQDDMFKEFLSIDSDFEENEEYFREDTISLGFENESERISKEYNELFIKQWNDTDDQNDEYFSKLIGEYLEELAHKSIEGNQFILGNDTYTSDYKITIIQTDPTDYDEEITIVISYIG
tara:strand:- start:1522 stop:1926 length:405 start_codon:yes stop_codon:yes gene_type:complete